uniref:Uncharacterized protein n=1 Tax=Arundo donax TaxID=35708 RepID=A0A0A8XNC3_ARUDO
MVLSYTRRKHPKSISNSAPVRDLLPTSIRPRALTLALTRWNQRLQARSPPRNSPASTRKGYIAI